MRRGRRMSGVGWMVLFLAAAAVPATAVADDDWGEGSNCSDEVCGSIVGILVGGTELLFLGVDLGYGASGEWIPLGWAWTQTVWGGLNGLTGLVMVPAGALVEDDVMLGLGVGFGVLGIWFLVHGIISLVDGYSEPEPAAPSSPASDVVLPSTPNLAVPPPPAVVAPPPDKPTALLLPRLSFAPVPGGGMVGLSLRL